MKDIDDIIIKIARESGTTPQTVKEEMQKSINEAIADSRSDPQADAFWHTIPCGGEEVTVEDFLSYIAAKIIMQG